MENSFEVDGKTYVSSKRLAKKYGYTNDHISRLCRQGKVRGQRIARTWFVDEEDLISYQSNISGNGWGNGHQKKVSSTPARAKSPTYKTLPIEETEKSATPEEEKTTPKQDVSFSTTRSAYSTASTPLASQQQFEPEETFEALPNIQKTDIGPEPNEGAVETEEVSEQAQSKNTHDGSLKNKAATPYPTRSEDVSTEESNVLFQYVSLPLRNAVLFLSILSLFSVAHAVNNPTHREALYEQTAKFVFGTEEVLTQGGNIAAGEYDDALANVASIQATAKEFVDTAALSVYHGVEETKENTRQRILTWLGVPDGVQHARNDTFYVGGLQNFDFNTETKQPQVVRETRVVERVVERETNKGPIVAQTSGISREVLETRLQEVENELRQKIYEVRGSIPESNSVQTNFGVIAQSQKIDNLDDVTIANATISGSTLSGSSVDVNSGTFGSVDISGGFTGASATFSGALTTQGSVTFYQQPSFPTFNATSTSGTSNIAGDLEIGGNLTVSGTQSFSGALTLPYFVATSTATSSSIAYRLGIGTTSPYTTLSVSGDAVVTDNITASNFTATSSIASVFPYASTTAITTTSFFPTDIYSFTLQGDLLANGQNITNIGTATGTDIEFINATTTNATSTNFFTSILDATTGTVTNLTATDATTTNATSTNLFTTNFTANGKLTLTGVSTDMLLSLNSANELTATSTPTLSHFFATSTTATSSFAGNVDVNGNTVLGDGTSDRLTITARVDSDIIPTDDTAHDLGSSARYWNVGYIDTLKANNIDAASTTISGTQSSTFTINSDNTSADTESMDLIFNRGSVSPNALISWNATTNRFDINQEALFEQGIIAQASSTLFGLTVSGNATTTGNQLVQGNTTLEGTLGVTGAATLSDILTVTNLATFQSGFLSQASSTIGDGTQQGGLTITGGATTTGDQLVQGDTTLSGLLDLTGAATFGSTLTVGGNIIPDTDSAYNIGANSTRFANIFADSFDSAAFTLSGAGTDMLLSTDSSGNVVATSTPTLSHLFATSTTATSTFAGGATFATGGGNVGIGLANPDTPLAVSAGGNTFEFSPADATINAAGSSDIRLFAGGQNIFRGLDGWTSNWADSAATTYFQTGRSGGNTTFSTYLGSLYKRVSFLVDDSIAGNGFVITDDSSSAAIPNGFFEIRQDNDTPNFVLDYDGNIGIGTTSPAAKLGVAGLAYIGGTGTSTVEDNLEVLGALQVGNSSLYLDNTSITNLTGDLTVNTGSNNTLINPNGGNVGIGTTSPGSRLSVGGASGESYSSAIFGDGTGDDAFEIVHNNAGLSAQAGIIQKNGSVTFVADDNTFLSAANGSVWLRGGGGRFDNILFDNTDGEDLVTIGAQSGTLGIGYDDGNNSNLEHNLLVKGNTGLGTTSPFAKLSVSGDIYADGDLTVSGLTATTSISAPYFTATDSSATSTFAGGFNVASGGFVYDHQTGNVGIGTESPSYPLSIFNSETSGNNNLQEWATANDGAELGLIFNDTTNSFEFTSDLGTAGSGYSFISGGNGITMRLSTSDGKSQVIFQDSTEAVQWEMGREDSVTDQFFISENETKRFVISENSGKVGIGTTSPYAKLSVAGDAVIGGDLTVSGLTATTSISAPYFTATDSTATSTFAGGFNVASGGFVYDHSTGFVGIGNDSPTSELHIGDGTGDNPVLSLDKQWHSAYESTISFKAGGIERAYIKHSSSTHALVYKNMTNSAAHRFITPGNQPRVIEWTGTRPGSSIWGLQSGINGVSDAHAAITADGNIVMSLLDTGEIGIGDTTPSARLTASSTSEQFRLIYDETNSQYSSFTVDSNNDLTINAAGRSDQLVVDSAGRIGIGTNDPSGVLHVDGSNTNVVISGSTQAIQAFRDSGHTSGQQSFDIRVDDGLMKFSSLNDGFTGFTNEGILALTHGGNVGIGTTSPSDVLSVAGDVSFSEGDEYQSFFWDATNGRLGIGTNAPSHQFQLVSSANDYSTKIFNLQNSDNDDIIKVTADGRTFIGADDGLNSVLSVNQSGAKTDGSIATFSDSSGTLTMNSTSFSTNAANFSFGGNGNGNALEMIAPANNGMLRINGENTTIGQQSLNGTPDKTLRVWNSLASGVTDFRVQEGSGQGTDEVFGVYANDDTTPRLVVQNGNVGIGTTSPYAQLSVAGDAVIGGDLTVSGLTSTTSISAPFFTATDSSATSTFAGGINVSSGGLVYDHQTGNVGIGRSNPNAHMQIFRDLSNLGTSNTNNLNSSHQLVIQGDGDVGDTASIGFQTHGDLADNRLGAAIVGEDVGSGLSTELVFFAGQGTAALTERFRIHSDGNFTFGTSSNQGSATVDVVADNDTQTTSFEITDENTRNPLFFLRSQGTNNDSPQDMYVSGNVGIGTTSPFAKLSVSGDIYADGDLTVSGLTATTSISAPYFTATDASATSTFAGGINVDSGGIVYDHQTGNVGIGTAVPSEKMDVQGNLLVGDDLVIYSNNSTDNSTYSSIRDGGTGALVMSAKDGQDIFLNWDQPNTDRSVKIKGFLESTRTNSSATLWNENGGIRVSNADGTNNTWSGIQFDDGGAIAAGIAAQYYDTANNYGSLHFSTRGASGFTTNAMVIKDGNVGIGTTSPAAKLGVAGLAYIGGTGTSTVEDNLEVLGALQVGNSSLYLDNTSITNLTGDLTVNTGSNNTLINPNGGNVGIGTTSPSVNLHVYENPASAEDVRFLVQNAREGVGTDHAFIDVQGQNKSLFRGFDSSGTQRFNFGYNSDIGQVAVLGYGGGTDIAIDSSGNVGIGTTSPQKKLHISGSGEQVIALEDVTNQRWTINTGGGFGTNLSFRNADTGNQVVIDNAGNIGIGTTSPQELLHVQSGLNYITNSGSLIQHRYAGDGAGINRFSISSNVGVDFGVDFISGTDSAGGVQFCEPGGGNCSVITGGGTNNSSLIFGTNGNNERMRITNTGNVGIGTTSPDHLLHVSGGQIAIDNNSYVYGKRTDGNYQELIGLDSNDDLFINRNALTSGVEANAPKAASAVGIAVGSGKLFTVRNSSNNTLFSVRENNGNVHIGGSSNVARLFVDTTTTDTPGIIVRTTDDSTNTNLFEAQNSSGNALAIIDANGNLGIGTTSPYAQLSVAGDAVIGGDLTVSGLTATTSISAPYFTATDSSATSTFAGGLNAQSGAFVVESGSGNVGIGTAGPEAKLDVRGGAIFNDDGVDADFRVEGDNDNALFWVDAGNDRVGIGAFNPSTKFEVRESNVGDDTTLKIYNADTTNSASGAKAQITVGGASAGDPATWYHVNGVSVWAVGTDNSDDDKFKISNNIGGNFGAGDDVLTINNTGNVGIGTTSPSDVLSVAGDVSFSEGDNYRSFFWDATQGRLGIGTTNPGVLLDVRGTARFGSSGTLDIGNDSLTTSQNSLSFEVDDNGNESDGYIRFLDSGNELVRIQENGNVGIGTTSPYAKLSVAGDAVIGGDLTISGLTATTSISAPFFTATDASATSTFAGGINIASGGLVYDHQTGSVGIGTESPNSALNVTSGNITSTGHKFINENTTGSDTNFVSLFAGTNLAVFQYADDLNFGITAATGQGDDGSNNYSMISFGDTQNTIFGDMSFNQSDPGDRVTIDGATSDNTSGALSVRDSNSTNLLFVRNDGNVGIGTTSPKGALEVNGQIFTSTGSADAPAIEASNFADTGIWFRDLGNGVGTIVFEGEGTGGNSIFELNSGGTRKGYLTGGGNMILTGSISVDQSANINRASYGLHDDTNTGLGGDEADSVSLVTGGVAGLIVDSSQNVGVGTTSPFAKLSVSGDIYADGDLTVSGLTATTSISAPYFTATDSSATSTFAGGINVSSGGLVYDHQTGNVGIGTESPAYKLSVSDGTDNFGFSRDSMNTRSIINLPSQANENLRVAYGNFSGSSFSLYSGGGFAADWFRVERNGDSYFNTGSNVGIGTTSPSDVLSVTGDVSFSEGDNYRSFFWDATSGELGLGTTNPGAGLQVHNPTSNSELWITNTANQGVDAVLKVTENTAGTFGGSYRYSDSTGHIEFRRHDNSASGSTVFYYDRNDDNVIFNGNVGIGTTSPYAKLSVVGETVAENFTATSTTATSTFAGGFSVADGKIQHDVGAGVTSIETLNLGATSFDDDAGQVSWIDLPITSNAPSGRVQSYTAQIDANSVLTVYGEADGSGGAQNLRVGIGSSTPDAQLTIEGAAGQSFDLFSVASSTGSRLFTITESGNVGVGTTSPYRALSVVGDAVITGDLSFNNFTASGTPTFSDLGTDMLASINSNGELVATSTPTMSHFFATSTTATSTIAGGLNIQNNGFVVESGSGNVGVGTANPLEKFHVTNTGDGSVTTGLYLKNATGADGGIAIDFDNTVSNNVQARINSVRTSDSNFSTDLAFHTNNTSGTLQERLRIDTNGNVGIGTTSPASALQIGSDAGSFQSGIQLGSTGPVYIYRTSSGVLAFRNSANELININQNLFGGVTYGGISYTDTNRHFGLTAPSGKGIALFTNGVSTPKLFVDSSGNVGIGTTSPSDVLSVAGDVSFSEGDNYRSFYWDATNRRLGLGDTSNVGALLTLDGAISSAGDPRIRLNRGGIDGGSGGSNSTGAIEFGNEHVKLFRNNNDLEIWTYDKFVFHNNQFGTQPLVIESSGNVGIGTTSPYAKLSVVGEAVFETFNATSTAASSTIAHGLNVGAINQTGSATSTFANGIALSGGCFELPSGECAGTGGGSGSGTVESGTTGQMAYYASDGTTLTATSSIFLDTTGNVGIGTTNPQTPLDVQGTASSTRFYANDGSISAPAYSFAGNTNTGLHLDSAGDLNFVHNGNKFFEINSSFLIEISRDVGNSNPGRALLRAGAVSGTSPGFAFQGDTDTGLGRATTDELSLVTGGLEALRINSSGNVGIGTTSPASLLSVAGDTWLDSNVINFASSSAATLTVNYRSAATSTIPDSQKYAWSIATSTDAHPIFSIDTSGTDGGSGTATTSVQGSVSIDDGRFQHDAGAGITSIEKLNLGPQSFDDNAGKVSWIDLPVTSSAATGTPQAFSAQLDSNQLFTVYGQANGSGALNKARVLVGTSTDTVLGSSNIPFGSFLVADGALCVDNGGATNCDDSARSAGNIYAEGASVTEIDVAENYPTKDADLKAGELVMFDAENEVFVKRYDRTQVDTASSTATSTPHADIRDTFAGVVSTEPGLLLGGFGNEKFAGETEVPVALTGRVPVLVNGEGGAIKPGDRISFSSTPGVGTRATTSGITVGVALESFNTASSTATSTVMTYVDSQYYFAPNQFAIDRSGNVAFGTTTDSAYRVKVDGDVAATGFVNISASSTKENIKEVSAEEKEGMLKKLRGMFVATYRYDRDEYMNSSTTNATTSDRLGLIAERAPEEVLSSDGKGVDLYKFVTFVASAVQSLADTVDKIVEKVKGNDDRIAELEKRILELESRAGIASASSTQTTTAENPVITINGNNPAYVEVGASYNDLGASVTDDRDDNLGVKASVNGEDVGDQSNVSIDTSTSTTHEIEYRATDNDGNTGTAVRTVVVGSGISGEDTTNDTTDTSTTTDSATDTATTTDPNTDTASSTDTTTDTSTSTPETTEPEDTTAPEIILDGSTNMELIVGDTYTEPGYSATDDTDGDITSDVVVGGDTVDAETAGEYTVTYNVSDSAGNAAEEKTRTITVVEPVDTTEDADTATSTDTGTASSTEQS